MKSKFDLRITKGNTILYESPEEGDTMLYESTKPEDLAESLAKAVNNLNIKEIKAIVVNGK